MKRAITLFLILFLLYGCSTFNNKKDEFAALKMRISTLESQVQTNSVNIKNNTLRINSLEQKLIKIKERLAKEREQDNFANKIPPISAIIGNDNSTSSEESKKIEFKSKKSVTEVSLDKSTNKKIASDMDKKDKNDNLVKSQNENKPFGLSDNFTKKIKSKNYKSYYKKALNLYMKGNYIVAKDMFESFIKQYKNTDLTDNAIFWLAHCYLHLNQKDKAIAEFKVLIEQYPYGASVTGGKTDAALYDLIKIYSYDKKMSDYYRNILFKRFPMSRYAKIVKKIQGG